MAANILITGFGPFPDQPYNPSSGLVGTLSVLFSGAANTRFLILPTEYGRGLGQLNDELTAYDPDVVMCFGVAAQTQAIGLEKVAHNWRSCRIPDAARYVPSDPLIEPGGPKHLQSTLPLHTHMTGLRDRHIPVDISEDAGLYICNAALYNILAHARRREKPVAAGFIHIPDPLRSGNPGHQDLQDAGQFMLSTFMP